MIGSGATVRAAGAMPPAPRPRGAGRLNGRRKATFRGGGWREGPGRDGAGRVRGRSPARVQARIAGNARSRSRSRIRTRLAQPVTSQYQEMPGVSGLRVDSVDPRCLADEEGVAPGSRTDVAGAVPIQCGHAAMVKLVDTRDLKFRAGHPACGFESRSRHHAPEQPGRTVPDAFAGLALEVGRLPDTLHSTALGGSRSPSGMGKPSKARGVLRGLGRRRAVLLAPAPGRHGRHHGHAWFGEHPAIDDRAGGDQFRSPSFQYFVPLAVISAASPVSVS